VGQLPEPPGPGHGELGQLGLELLCIPGTGGGGKQRGRRLQQLPGQRHRPPPIAPVTLDRGGSGHASQAAVQIAVEITGTGKVTAQVAGVIKAQLTGEFIVVDVIEIDLPGEVAGMRNIAGAVAVDVETTGNSQGEGEVAVEKAVAGPARAPGAPAAAGDGGGTIAGGSEGTGQTASEITYAVEVGRGQLAGPHISPPAGQTYRPEVAGPVAARAATMRTCYNLPSLVDVVVFSDDYGVRKPDRAIFQITLDLSVCPGGVLRLR
jgi:hypothetical protein